MALCGTWLNSSMEGIDLRLMGVNLPSSSVKSVNRRVNLSRKSVGMMCRASRSSVSEEKKGAIDAVEDDELGLVNQFKMSDFVVSDCVSVGLGGRVWLLL